MSDFWEFSNGPPLKDAKYERRKNAPSGIKSKLDILTKTFFRAVSFTHGKMPHYNELYNLFINEGLLIKNNTETPEISSISQFVEPRRKLVISGQLTSFTEFEQSEITEIFGNEAHRLSTYEKSGTLNGSMFNTKGIISTQFIMTPLGWKMNAMAWDDERPGLTIPIRYKSAGPALRTGARGVNY